MTTEQKAFDAMRAALEKIAQSTFNARAIAEHALAMANAAAAKQERTESILIDGNEYTVPAPVAAEILRLHLENLGAIQERDAIYDLMDSKRKHMEELRGALAYHMEQPRPIQRSIDALAAGKQALAGMVLTLKNAPIGTKAPAYGGGHWIRVERGWKWCTGATFPRPGGDWTGKLIHPQASEPAPSTAGERTGNTDIDAALIMLDRMDVGPEDDARVDAVSETLRKVAAILSAQALPVGELTESELMKCIAQAGCFGTVKLSYESGPYDIDRPTLNATKLSRAILAAARSQPVREPLDGWKSECQRVQALFEKETLRDSELHEQLRQVREHRDHCLRVVEKLKNAKPGCAECAKWMDTTQANKEWHEGVTKGRDILTTLAAESTHGITKKGADQPER